MNIKKLNNKYLIIEVGTDLVLENIQILEDKLKEIIKQETDVIINLIETVFIDSSSLGIIIMYLYKYKKINKHLILVNCSHELLEMFEITNLTKRFNIFKTVEDGIQFLKSEE
jgi:anti-anti-sigma factor